MSGYIHLYTKKVWVTKGSYDLGFFKDVSDWAYYPTLEAANEAVIKEGGHIVKTIDVKVEVTEKDD